MIYNIISTFGQLVVILCQKKHGLSSKVKQPKLQPSLAAFTMASPAKRSTHPTLTQRWRLEASSISWMISRPGPVQIIWDHDMPRQPVEHDNAYSTRRNNYMIQLMMKTKTCWLSQLSLLLCNILSEQSELFDTIDVKTIRNPRLQPWFIPWIDTYWFSFIKSNTSVKIPICCPVPPFLLFAMATWVKGTAQVVLQTEMLNM